MSSVYTHPFNLTAGQTDFVQVCPEQKKPSTVRSQNAPEICKAISYVKLALNNHKILRKD
jgi:hypothetical protein